MNWKSVLAAAIAVAMCSVGSAQTKVAYVDIDRVTAKSKQVNDAMSSVETKVKGIQGELAAKQKLLDSLNDEIKKGQGVLAESEITKKRQDAQKLQLDIDQLELQGKRKMQELDQTFFDPMLKRIVFAIQDVAHDKKIDLVVRGEAVLYGANSADITDAVIDKLNSGDSSSSSSKSDKNDKNDKNDKSSKTDKSSTSDSTPSDNAEKSNTDSAAATATDNSAKNTYTDDTEKPSSNGSEKGKVDILPEPSRTSTRPVDRQKD